MQRDLTQNSSLLRSLHLFAEFTELLPQPYIGIKEMKLPKRTPGHDFEDGLTAFLRMKLAKNIIINHQCLEPSQ